ncbi:hypothetical protein BS17DRAFT_879220 [Gyrodon lividus]|nr:hypothetical protein BS17DRAFT_879220 [Gyrodon lividus]
MEHQPRAQPPLHSFQARTLHFLKKLGLRARGSSKKSNDNMTSVDILRRPDISPLVGFEIKVGPNPTHTDDSSQDASTSGNSPTRRHRRYSAWDSLQTASISLTPAGYGPPPSSLRERAVLHSESPVDESSHVLAPTSSFMQSNLSLGAIVQNPGSPASSSRPGTPTVLPHMVLCPELSLNKGEEAVQSTDNDDTPRPSGGFPSPNDTVMTTPLDPSLATFFSLVPISRSQSLSAPEKSSSETIHERPHLTTPLPPPFRVATERGLRLSPSIITRQPMPILNLPTLPPPAPIPLAPSRSQVHLRSMPSLSVHGRSNAIHQAKHENATLGDSDEDGVDESDDDDEGEEEEEEEDEVIDALSVHQSDEEEDEPPSTGPSIFQGFKTSQKRPLREVESPVASPTSAGASHDGFSPTSPNVADYFCSRTYTQSIQLSPGQSVYTIHTFSPKTSIAEEFNPHNAQSSDPPTSGALLKSKPSLYRVASRSMINLGSARRAERGMPRLKSKDTVRSHVPSVSGQTVHSHVESEESDTDAIIGRLLRRTSMPSFHPTSDPPPYPAFGPRPKEHLVTPREDEGRERLPAYSNSLYLVAIMPLKMEFSSPGVQAKDRKWRRVVCELEGTAFRVYKCPPGASGVGVIGDWWEKRVGVGDMASAHYAPIRKKEEQFEKSSKLGMDQPPMPQASSSRSASVRPSARQTRRRSESPASLATQSTTTSTPRAAKRMSGASFLSPFKGSSTTHSQSRGVGSPSRRESRAMELLPVDAHGSRSSLSTESHESNGRVTPVPQPSPQPQPRSASRLSFLSTSRPQWRSGEIPKPSKSDLIRAYTLQHAESGLGNDYLKRKNVIRVRLEGEQFLLQAHDVPAVVEWIEGIHAGTGISLDLDQRPMPRGPMFPRRRRRRARRAQVEGTSHQASQSLAPHRLG